jgi:hypothetical protein
MLAARREELENSTTALKTNKVPLGGLEPRLSAPPRGGGGHDLHPQRLSPQELIEGESSTTIKRRVGDGTAYRLVKVPYRAAELAEQLDSLGWHVTIRETSGRFYWGEGSRSRSR